MLNQRKNSYFILFFFLNKIFIFRNSNKRSGINQLRRQLTDESPNKQRTPPNSTGTSLSPNSSSFFNRDTNPIRITNASNTIRMSSPATTKQLDSVTLLLKQTIAPAQLIQVISKNFYSYEILLLLFFNSRFKLVLKIQQNIILNRCVENKH